MDQYSLKLNPYMLFHVVLNAYFIGQDEPNGQYIESCLIFSLCKNSILYGPYHMNHKIWNVLSIFEFLKSRPALLQKMSMSFECFKHHWYDNLAGFAVLTCWKLSVSCLKYQEYLEILACDRFWETRGIILLKASTKIKTSSVKIQAVDW